MEELIWERDWEKSAFFLDQSRKEFELYKDMIEKRIEDDEETNEGRFYE